MVILNKIKYQIILLIGFILLSCKSIQYVPIETIRYEKEYINVIRIDSVYMRDSIYIRQLNDTILIDKYQYIYRNIYLSDTVQVFRVDSIPYPVEVEVIKKEKYVPFFTQIFYYLGVQLVIILGGKYLINYLKKLMKL